MALLADLLGESPKIVALRAKVARLLQNSSNGRRLPCVFIQGETGTGKSILARAMHNASERRGSFVQLNAGGITETIAESALFGHERGAFTGAHEARPGVFQQANHGTLFLDEIALLPPSKQGTLLVAIENKTVRRVGGTRDEPVDVWVVAASNEDIERAISERRFRQDLYERLAQVVLEFPPLRERESDILLLAESFLESACRQAGLPSKSLDADARGALLAYDWPGNVRQLKNVIESAVLFAESDVITASALELRRFASREPSPVRREPDDAERERILAAWRDETGNLSRAATRLGMKRNTLRYRLIQLGVLKRKRGAAIHPPEPPPDAQDAIQTTSASELRRLALLRAELGSSAAESPASTASWTAAAMSKVTDFGGTVFVQGPTSAVAAFGLEPVEDAPGRAAHTAMALQRAAARARADGQEVHVKLAVDVRRCSVRLDGGSWGLDEGVGHELETRLDALGALGELDAVVTSEAAATFLQRHFEVAPLDLPAGSRQRVYRIVGTVRPGLAGRRVAAFVGRGDDLAVLNDRLAAVVRGKGQAIAIVGEAGIGKSRLVTELRRSLAGEDVAWLEAACFSYARTVPYVPVLAILRQACGLSETDSAAVVATRLREQLKTLGLDVDESAPYLFQLFGLREGTEPLSQLPAETIRNKTRDIFREMIVEASARRPVVLVVEDVHWADRASEEILNIVATDRARILLLCTYRPGFNPPAWMVRSFATQIALSRLSEEDSRTMLQSVVEETVTEPVARMILDKADGNPFFLEEISRAVEELGHTGTLPQVPDTIADVLLARIARLPSGPKSVLEAASVLGREFAARLLESVWRGPGTLEAHLAQLTELEFLYQRASSRGRTYVFTHSLIQQVAEESVEAERRRELHVAAGRALETLFADRLEEVYDRLAYHYSRTEEAARAVDYLSALAGKAARAGAREEAVLAWRQALQHVERLPPSGRDRRRLQVLVWLAGTLLPLGRIPEIGSLLLPERERLESLKDPALTAQYYFLLSRMYMLGEHARVPDSAQRAIKAAELCGDDATMGGVYGVWAVACVLLGRAAEGIDHAQRAVELLEKTQGQWSLSYAYWALGLCASQLGRFTEALAAGEKSLRFAKAVGDAGLEVSAAWGIGIVHAAMGESSQGIENCLRAVRAARDPLYGAIAHAFLGFAYTESGDARSAITVLMQSIPLVGQFGLKAYEAWFTAFRAEAYRLAGQLESAEMDAERARRTAKDVSFPFAMGWAQLTQGRIAMDRRDFLSASAKLEAALETFTATHSRYECGRVHMEQAEVSWESGHPDTAREHLREAHKCFVELDVPRYRDRVVRRAAELELALDS